MITHHAQQQHAGNWRWWLIFVISVLLLLPCFWHKRIEAGDLASHTYNAWLAQLIERGQAPGLYIARQWSNVLVDVALLRLGNAVGLAAAEKIVVSVCVLTFFWGAFALISAATDRRPWVLAPGIAMIAYGWTFHMGFMNYYLSLGLAFWAGALFWRGRRTDFAWGLFLGVLVMLAHPLGLLWLVGSTAYIKSAEKLSGRYRWIPLALALLCIVTLHYYVIRFRTEYWDTRYFLLLNGANQLALFSNRYLYLMGVVLIFGIACFIHGVVTERKSIHARHFRTALELWAVLIFMAAVIPEVVWLPQYAGPVGMIVARLTSVTAVLGLCLLSSVPPKKWHLAGLAACAIVFFAWIYQDTGDLNRMEQQADELVSHLPYGRRVVETIWAPPESDIPFIDHIVDRACVGRCFAYANYEPSSGQFRIRVRPGSPVVTDVADATEQMESGEYIVQASDLPMTQIYQCGAQELTQLCARDLQAGEANGRLGYHPPKD